jgi:SpoVK/Ycf46/Vps4 family AAA+-type ATPase
MTDADAPSSNVQPAAPAMKSFAQFFDPKAQAQRQADAEKRMKEADDAASALIAGSSKDKNGVYHMPHENINGDSFRGDTVAWGKSSAEIDTLEEERLAVKARMPWTEKYRPESLTDVISHENILTTLDALIARGSLPHLLFYGPPGTGKTSTALAVARRLNGAKEMRRMVLELNASDDRGIDTVRDKIKEFASSRQLFQGGTKLIILDEVRLSISPSLSAFLYVWWMGLALSPTCMLFFSCGFFHSLTHLVPPFSFLVTNPRPTR